MSSSIAVVIALWVVPVVLAITVHEVAHGWVAERLGDPTARERGRLTLNPLKHVDPVGTVLVPGLLVWAGGGYVFGWAKPVPVDARRLRRPRQDMAWVAAAGPGANLLMALAWSLVVRGVVDYHGALGSMAEPLLLVGVAGIVINSVLLVVNLLPLPPLDGGRILVGLLPLSWARKVARVEPFGLVAVLVLLTTGYLGPVLALPLRYLEVVMLAVAGLDQQLLAAALRVLGVL